MAKSALLIFLVLAVVLCVVEGRALTRGKYSLEGCKTPIEQPSLPATHKETRAKFVSDWLKTTSISNAVIFLPGKTVSMREFTDTEVQFRQESNFLYLTGVTMPDFNFAIEISNSVARPILFAPDRDLYWAVWNGVVETIEQMRARYGIQDIVYDTDMTTELQKISSGKVIYTLPGVKIPGLNNVNDQLLLPILKESRVVKTPLEIQWMEIAANVSSDAHVAVMRDTVEANSGDLHEFNFAGFFEYYTTSCGLLHMSYLPIVAYGKHAAILHYNVPTAKVDGGAFMLIDAGAEYTYGTDITRTFPVSGKFSPNQKLIYNMVLDIVITIESLLKPGQRYSAFQLQAREMVTRHLLANNFIQGTFAELMANQIYSFFYPHGLGHSVGIDVHDPGSIENIKENMVLTIEPGIYFNEVLLNNGFKEKGSYFNIPKCQQFLSDNFGGVRIEDTVQVTANGMRVLSTVPKTVDDIERIMNQ